MKAIRFLGFGAMACTAHATENAPQTPDEAHQQLQALLQSEQYSKITHSKTWVKNTSEEPIESGFWQWLTDVLQYFESWSYFLGVATKTALLLALVVFVVWLIWQYRVFFAQFTQKIFATKRNTVRITPTFVQNHTHTLPEHKQLYQSAKALWRAGQYTACASLLYRGVLRLYVSVYHMPITAHQTEAQCLALVDKSTLSMEERRFFVALVGLWQTLAYQGVAISESDKQNLYNQLAEFERLYPADTQNR